MRTGVASFCIKNNSLFRSTFQRSTDFGDVTHGSLGKIIGFFLFFCEGMQELDMKRIYFFVFAEKEY